MSTYDIGSPTLEVTVYRDGEVLARTLCETAEEAADVVREWVEVEGVRCEVDDLSVHHTPDAIRAPDSDTDVLTTPGIPE
jgi:hypothetical protein